MSTKQFHVLSFWLDHLRASFQESGVSISAGTLAKRVGQSRTTAQKYLRLLKHTGYVIDITVKLPNGIDATYYAPLSVVRHGDLS